MKKILMALVAGSVVGGAAIAQDSKPAEAKPATSWTDKVTLTGDVRVRYEDITEDGKEDRQRDRFRLRLGADAKVSDELKIGTRLTSSENGDRASGNSTFTGGGSKKDVYIDLAYIDYAPAALGGLSLVGGKMELPYIAVADNIWDGDYTPEGFALKYATDGDLKLITSAGYHWLVEESSSEDDAKQLGAQIALKAKTGDKGHVLAGVGYYGTQDLEGDPLFDEKSYGNSSDKIVDGGETNAVFASEYEVVEGFAEVGLDLGLPVKVYGSYTVNQDADDEDTGYLIGLTAGKAKDVGTLEGGYNWRSLEKDAVLGALSDSDSFGGGTNGEGHKLFLKYQLAKNLQLGATYYLQVKDPDGKDIDYDRLQLDAVAKF